MNNNKAKIIFFDVDNTIFDHVNSCVSPLTIYSLTQLKKKGYKLCICTGRSLDELREIDRCVLDLFDDLICLSGSYIVGNNKHIALINKRDVEDVINTLDSYNMTYRYATADGKGYLNKHDKLIEELFYKDYQMIPEIKSYNSEEVLQIMYYGKNKKIENEIAKHFSNLNVIVNRVCGEINNKNTNKGEAIAKVCNDYNYGLFEAIAFGDDDNDIPMFEKVGFSVCLEDGSDKAKEKSNYVSSSSSNNGIYNACLDLGLIEKCPMTNNYYFGRVKKGMQYYLKNKMDEITKIATIFKNTIKNGGVVQMLGVGKMEEFAQELYYRSGGIAQFHKMSESDSLVNGLFDNDNNVNEFINLYNINQKDSFLLISEKGNEPFMLMLAKMVKAKNQKLVAIVRKCEDESIINYSDEMLILHEKTNPIDVTIDDTLAQFLSFKTYELLKEDGITPLIFESNNNPNSKKHNERILDMYKGRIHQ